MVPVGGGNDAARAFGLPHDDPVAAAGLLPGLPRRRVDLVRADGRRYLNIAGAGFDSEVNRVANARLRWAPSMLRYVGAMVVKLATERPVRFTVTLDGRAEELAAWLVVVANGRSYGGGMRVAPGARLDDGLLDVVVIGDLTKPDFLATFPKVYAGRHVEHPLVTVSHARRVELAADRPRAVYADGEHAGELPMAFEVEPAALAVLAAARRARPRPGCLKAGSGPGRAAGRPSWQHGLRWTIPHRTSARRRPWLTSSPPAIPSNWTTSSGRAALPLPPGGRPWWRRRPGRARRWWGSSPCGWRSAPAARRSTPRR